MKTSRALTRPARGLALALTWDGVRQPLRSLPAAARAFLEIVAPAPSMAHLGALLQKQEIDEIRVCWIPHLQGGDDVLCPPFSAGDGLRIGYRAAQSRRFGDILGVVYRRKK
jgi:hypothetical protein